MPHMLTPLRVCVATTVFPHWCGHGEGTFIWQFVKALRLQAIDVRVVAMHSPGLPTHDVWEDVEIVRPPYWWPMRAEMLRKDGGGLPINFRRYPLARVQLPALLLAHTAAIAGAARGCNLVHAHFTLAAAAALAAQLRHRLPVVTTVHGSDIFQVPKLPLGAAFTRTTLRRCAAVTTVSTALAEACAALDVPPAQLSVIPNSVDTDLYAPRPQSGWAEREPFVLFVGSLIARKGVDTLIRAFAQLLRHQPDAAGEQRLRLVLVGEGPQQAQLAALAAELGIAESVVFAGFLTQAEVADLMRRARLFVLPSREEGQGVVLLEAMASGAPVVASAVGGIPEVVQPGTGCLVPPDDVQALAAQMSALCREAGPWEQLSRAGRLHVERHYAPQSIGARFRQLYESVLARQGGKAG